MSIISSRNSSNFPRCSINIAFYSFPISTLTCINQQEENFCFRYPLHNSLQLQLKKNLQGEPSPTSQAVQRGFRKPFQNPTLVHLSESRTQPQLFISTIQVYYGKNPDLCKHIIIQCLIIATVKTPLAFIFFLTFIHSLRLLSHRGRKEPGVG